MNGDVAMLKGLIYIIGVFLWLIGAYLFWALVYIIIDKWTDRELNKYK
jgi:uncharacterized protein YggT (Ycf19 family)